MDQGNFPPLSSGYAHSCGDADCPTCLDAELNARSGTSAYTTSGAVDLPRDDSGQQHLPTPFAFSAAGPLSSGARLLPESSVSVDVSRYRSSGHLLEATSDSITPTPASILAPGQYPGYANHLPAFPPGAQVYAPGHPYGVPRVPSIGDGVPSHAALVPRPHGYLPPSHPDVTSALSPGRTFGNLSETPRPAYGYGIPPYAYPDMAPPNPPPSGNNPSESQAFPWMTMEYFGELVTEDGESILPEVFCSIEKGLFIPPHDSKWTCYRRNYFAALCWYTLWPPRGGKIFLKLLDGPLKKIEAFSMDLRAEVEGQSNKPIELVQHTPKRDNGPKNKIGKSKAWPSPHSNLDSVHVVPPHGDMQAMSLNAAVHMRHPTFVPADVGFARPDLSCQHEPDPEPAAASNDNGAHQQQAAPTAQCMGMTMGGQTQNPSPPSGQGTSVTFDRIQFKQATANNGKRRASQQYFVLTVSLYADIREDGASKPVWVKIASRTSEKIVVRGRSPSHYSDERRDQSGSGSGGADAASGRSGNQYMGSQGPTHAGPSSGMHPPQGPPPPYEFRGGYGASAYGDHQQRHAQYWTARGSQMLSPSLSPVSPGETLFHGRNMPSGDADDTVGKSERNGIPESSHGSGYAYFQGPVRNMPGPMALPVLPAPRTATDSARYPTTDPRDYAPRNVHFLSLADPTMSGAQWANGDNQANGYDSSRDVFGSIQPPP